MINGNKRAIRKKSAYITNIIIFISKLQVFSLYLVNMRVILGKSKNIELYSNTLLLL